MAQFSADSDEESTFKSTLVSKTSEAVNATRGTMVMLLIFIHWSPGIFERLSIDFERMTNPLFRMGTPGFAIIFGIAVGLYSFQKFRINSKNAMQRIRFSLKILLLGIGILASIRYLNILITTDGLGIHWPVELFFSVLLYYLLAVASIPLWYFILSKFKNMEIAALIGATLFFGVGAYVKYLLPTSEGLNGFARLGGLMVEAKYNYFDMSGIAFMGLAVGLYIKRLLNNEQKADNLLIPGFLLILFGIIISFVTGQAELWLTADMTPVWMNISYLGCVLILLSLTLYYGASKTKNPLVLFLFQLLAVFGSLSLRMYIGHGLVIPFKNLLVAIGLPYAISLSISMALFIIAMGLPARKLYKKYYGSQRIIL